MKTTPTRSIRTLLFWSRWPLLVLIGGASLLLMARLSLMMTTCLEKTSSDKTSFPSLSISQAFMLTNRQGAASDRDPTNLIGNPQSFDTRPCVAHPSAATCDGLWACQAFSEKAMGKRCVVL